MSKNCPKFFSRANLQPFPTQESVVASYQRIVSDTITAKFIIYELDILDICLS